MIVVNARFEVDEDVVEEIRHSLADMERASRGEAGCLDYTFSRELNDPSALRITERWSSAEALAAHFRTPHMARFQAAIAHIERRGLELHFYRAEEIAPPGV